MQQPQEIDDSPAEQAVARVAAVDVAKASGEVCTRMPRDPGGDGAACSARKSGRSARPRTRSWSWPIT